MATPASSETSVPAERPSEETLLRQWADYFADPMLSLARLRQEAEEGRLHERGLRSLSWRFFFDLLPDPTPIPSTPTSGAGSTFDTYRLLLSQSRSSYTELRERYLRAPDGRWVQDEGDEASPLSKAKQEPVDVPRLAKVEVRGNNPLGLEEENPWKTWFEDLELRKVIRQDVLRTFPEVDYFRSPTAQHRLTDLLFIFCKLTPQIGYRQGMHELLAPILWLVDYDSLAQSHGDSDSLPRLALSRDHVEHDTWALFSALMKPAKAFYDHTPSVPAHSPHTSNRQAANGAASPSAALVQPVVAVANHIYSLLRGIDPELHRAFASMQVEPQLYAIRWLRLLFSREFPFADTLLLWDGLFARDPSLQLSNHIVLAMLLRVRNALLHAAAEGYGEFVQVLLRYPACDDGRFMTPLLVRQAVYLRENLSPPAAQVVIGQNVNEKAAVGSAFDGQLDPLNRGSLDASRSHSRAPSVPSQQGLGFLDTGLVGDLAKGVYGRAEALGINKALRGTFDEIKRTVAEAQAQAEERRRSNAYSQIPARPPWDPQRSPPPPPVVDKDTLASLASMRAASQAMSGAIDVCVLVLEQTLAPQEANGVDQSKSSADEGARHAAIQMMALTTLRHVRDVLSGQAPTFDPSVLQPLRELSQGSDSDGVEHGRSGSGAIPLRPTTANSSRDPLSPSGPVDGLGAGFARLDVSPSASSPRAYHGNGPSRPAVPKVRTAPKSAQESEGRSASSPPPQSAKARTPDSTPSGSPTFAEAGGRGYPPPREGPASSVRALPSSSSERRPFDPLGVL